MKTSYDVKKKKAPSGTKINKYFKEALLGFPYHVRASYHKVLKQYLTLNFN
jgi:hypothetical protein